MPQVRRHTLWPLFLAVVACGASAPPAVAPHQTLTAASAEESMLVPYELKDTADIARAVREYYTKYEYRIAMRDGVHLYTVAYVPKDRSRTYPILLLRTPYGVEPYGVDNYPDGKNARTMKRFAPSSHFVSEGYVFVHQDVRGRMMSEGTFVDVRPYAGVPGGARGVDEATDAWDTIDFLVKNVPANNGKVGAWGISYPGFYAAQAAIDAHPALKAVSPQAPVTDWFLGDDFHHNGAFLLADAFDFYATFGRARPKPIQRVNWSFDYDVADAYDFFLALGPLSNANTRYLNGDIAFWNEMMAHGTRDEFWKARDPRPHYKEVKPALLTVGGLFDAEDLWGALETYHAFQNQSPRGNVSLVMGPWRHGGWARTEGDHLGDVSFGTKSSQFFQEKIQLPFFRQHLKGKPAPPATEAWMFETGTNVWERYPAWPPPNARATNLSFRATGKLAATAPTAKGDETGFDTWVSDPQKPVPYRDKHSGDIEAEYMSDDQRFAGRRPDVVVYDMGTLTADVTLAGPIEASLWVSTTGTDADFIVKLIDVYPQDHADPDPNPTNVRMGGYQQLVRGEVMRGKFRTSFERPEPFKPGEPTLVRFTLPDVNHTFRTGHRIMVQVQSSWFPLVDRNPQTFTDIYKATESDFKTATHQVYRTKDRPSGIRVMVVKGTLPTGP